jgi:hypothetical protein
MLHDRILELGWLSVQDGVYDLTAEGVRGLEALTIDVGAMRALRRKLAYGCLDWSERRCHLGGALGAALLGVALARKWLIRDTDGRGLSISNGGRREMLRIFVLRL